MLSERLGAALRASDEGVVKVDGETIVVRVDSVDRRYRDAIKAGAEPLEGPRDEPGLAGLRRVACLLDRETGRRVTIWSDGA